MTSDSTTRRRYLAAAGAAPTATVAGCQSASGPRGANGTANATGFGTANDTTAIGSGGSGSFGRLRRLVERP